MSHVHWPRPIVEPPVLKALFSTAVWGEAYVDRFLAYSLPTQLGAGNIGAFDQQSEYLIITDAESVERFKASPVVQALSRLVRVEYAYLDEVLRGFAGGDKYSKLAACQNFVLKRAADFQVLFFGYGDALWADTFDESIDRVFTLQDTIAASMAGALALTANARTRRSPCDGEDAEAYRAYLAGRHLGNRPSGTRMRQALASFRHAIDLDPSCARAFAGIAYAYRAGVMTGDRDPRHDFPLAISTTVN